MTRQTVFWRLQLEVTPFALTCAWENGEQKMRERNRKHYPRWDKGPPPHTAHRIMLSLSSAAPEQMLWVEKASFCESPLLKWHQSSYLESQTEEADSTAKLVNVSARNGVPESSW